MHEPYTTEPGAVRQGCPNTTSRRGERRRKRARRRLIISLTVLIGTVGGLFGLALGLASLEAKTAPSAAAPAAPAESESAPVISQSTVQEPDSSEPTRTPTPYDEAGIPLLFNFENPIPEEYLDRLELVDAGGGHQMETRAAAAFNAMYEAAEKDGLTLAQVSGFRTAQHQKSNYDASIQRYLNQGLSRERAIELTEGYYAIPGTSEHEAGLAMDIGFIEDSFESTGEFIWLQKHAAEYGFIMRYREEDFDITHIHYEPWHYRYVGANHAERMAEERITTLEEYVDLLAEEK